jgi:hypothetical protein
VFCSIGVCEKVITIGVEFWGVREGIGVCHLSVSSSLLQRCISSNMIYVTSVYYVLSEDQVVDDDEGVDCDERYFCQFRLEVG